MRVVDVDARRWIFTELAFGGEPVRRGGSTFTLERVSQVFKCAEQAHRVMRRRGVELDDLVLVEALPDGTVRNHWGHILRDEGLDLFTGHSAT